MLATIANTQKRLMLHRYFEEQRAIATRKIEALVRAQEHSMLIDMKLTPNAPDLRGVNFERTYAPPLYFPTQRPGGGGEVGADIFPQSAARLP